MSTHTAAAVLLSLSEGTRPASLARILPSQSSGSAAEPRSLSISLSSTYYQNPSVQSRKACFPGLSASKCVSTFISPSWPSAR